VQGRWYTRSLRTKVLLVAALINVATVALVTWQSSSKLEKIYLEQLSIRGETLTRSVVSALEPAMLDNDSIKAMAVLGELRGVPELAYAVAFDPAAKAVAHTFSGAVPTGLAAMHPLQEGQSGAHAKEISVGALQVLDISWPLIQGAVGTLHVAMDLSAARAQVRSMAWHSFLLMLGVLALGFFVLWVFMGMLVSPLDQLAQAARRIVDEGDLSQDLDLNSNDEVGRLGRDFQNLVLKLREIPLQLELSVRLLAEVAEQMEMASMVHGEAVLRQATSLQQAQIAAEELRLMSRSAADRARDVLNSTEEVDQISLHGEAAVVRSLQSMQEIRGRAQQTGERISELHGRMIQVGAISGTIKDLADQSNVLALNASIEAVRSGEHGKGFALVAREIRRLADQSIKANEEAKELLDSMSEAMNETQHFSVAGAARLEGEMDQLRKSGQSVQALTSLVKSNAGSVRQIVQAVTQQDEGIGQIFSSVTEQSQLMDRTRDHLDASKVSLSQLKELSQALTSLVKQYRV
jgi:methyl-accepting chemotaxis protein